MQRSKQRESKNRNQECLNNVSRTGGFQRYGWSPKSSRWSWVWSQHWIWVSRYLWRGLNEGWKFCLHRYFLLSLLAPCLHLKLGDSHLIVQSLQLGRSLSFLLLSLFMKTWIQSSFPRGSGFAHNTPALKSFHQSPSLNLAVGKLQCEIALCNFQVSSMENAGGGESWAR